MGRGKKAVREGLKVTFAAIPAPTGGRGIFGIEEAADAVRAVGSGKSTKGRRARELVVDCGTLTVRRGYDVCLGCRETSPLLEERLGLGEEQGRADALKG
jgi:hypothetical protein